MKILDLGPGTVPSQRFIEEHRADVVFVDARPARFDYEGMFPGSIFFENTRFEDFAESYEGLFKYILALNVLNAPNAGLIAHAGKLALLSYNILENNGILIMEVTYDGGRRSSANAALAAVDNLGLYETKLYFGATPDNMEHFASNHVVPGNVFSLHATKR